MTSSAADKLLPSPNSHLPTLIFQLSSLRVPTYNPPMRSGDFHLHTTHSDGVRSSREVIDLAIKHDLHVIAISDHDNIGAYFEVRDYASQHDVTLIPAVELSTDFENEDIHLLAYGFDASADELHAQLEEFRKRRLNRGALMVDRLIELGHPVTHARVDEIRGSASLGRPHIARALLEKGIVATIEEAFDKLLSPGKPGYVDTPRMSSADAIALTHRLGGIVSIAHPTLCAKPMHVIESLRDAGLDAIEAFHPDVPEEDRDRYLAFANENRMLITGGSDDHGFEGAITIGTMRLAEPYLTKFLDRVH
jgi:3',5'-nucleoside bisphosphate phosphatase